MPTINNHTVTLNHYGDEGLQVVHSTKVDKTTLGTDPLEELRKIDACLRLNGTVDIPLIRPQLMIGQSRQCDIILHDLSLEPVHAQLRWRFGRFVILSSHKMMVNGKMTNEHILRPDDEITLADVPLIYCERCVTEYKT